MIHKEYIEPLVLTKIVVDSHPSMKTSKKRIYKTHGLTQKSFHVYSDDVILYK